MASTYAAGLRARLDQQHEKGFGQSGFYDTEERQEERYQQALTSGYNTKRSNRCPVCFTAKSSKGTCNCEQ